MIINISGSKSLSQRYLILASTAKTPSYLKNLSNSDDTLALIEILKSAGVKFSKNNNVLTVYPPKTFSYVPKTVFNSKNGGTTLRFSFLIPFISRISAVFQVSAQLQNRPSDAMFNIINQLGGKTVFLTEKRFPFMLNPSTLTSSVTLNVDCSETGQVFSAVLLWASSFPEQTVAYCSENVVSESYIEMTLHTLDDFGISYEKTKNGVKILSQEHSGIDITCEPDMSLLPFVKLASDIRGKAFDIPQFNVKRQKDSIFFKFYEQLQQNKLETIDLKAFPDLLPPLAIASVFLKKTVRFVGIKHTEFKESNRKHALTVELSKLGLKTYETENSLEIKGEIIKSAELDSYEDHRLAMAFALLKLMNDKIEVKHKNSVTKSWRNFWSELEKFK